LINTEIYLAEGKATLTAQPGCQRRCPRGGGQQLQAASGAAGPREQGAPPNALTRLFYGKASLIDICKLRYFICSSAFAFSALLSCCRILPEQQCGITL